MKSFLNNTYNYKNGCNRFTTTSDFSKIDSYQYMSLSFLTSPSRGWGQLNNPLRHHRLRHFHKSGYIGSFDVIHIISFFAVFHALCMNIAHNAF